MANNATVKLVSMKRSAKDRRKDAGAPAPMESIGPDYPWGLCIHFDRDELEKLGIDTKKLPSVGTQMGMHVKVKVTAVRQVQYGDEREEETSVDLQITDAAIVGPGS